MTKLLNRFKTIFFALFEGVQDLKAYRRGESKLSTRYSLSTKTKIG